MIGLVETAVDPARARNFHTLDALRGIAAVSVVLFHAAFFYGISKPAEGQLAVDLFFVMSGFIVVHRYEPELRRGMGLGAFVRIRLVRLYPLFLLGMILGVIPALIAEVSGHADHLHKAMIESFPLAVLMLPSDLALPNLSELYPLNYVAWSLALELIINILYAATFRLWGVRNIVLLLGVAFVGLSLCAALFGRLDGGDAWQNVQIGIVRVVYGFAAGVLLCRLFERKPFALHVPWWLLLLATTALFFVQVGRDQGLWELLAITVAIPLIVAAAIGSEPPKCLHRTCALAGLLSYPIYSLHAPFIGFFMRGESLVHLDPNVQTHAEAFVFTLLLSLLCVAAQFFYDTPIRRALTARSRTFVPRSVAFSPAAATARR